MRAVGLLPSRAVHAVAALVIVAVGASCRGAAREGSAPARADTAARVDTLARRDTSTRASAPAAPSLPTGDEQADRARLEELKRAARALAHTGGCAAASECASIGLGARACGGPSEYVVYCPATTDVPALRAAAAAVERFERAFNERYAMVSICQVLTPPALELSGGSCRATTRGGSAGARVPGINAPSVPRVP